MVSGGTVDMKRTFKRSPVTVTAAITPQGKLKDFIRRMKNGEDLKQDDRFMYWVFRKVIPQAVEEADYQYSFIGGKIEDEFEYSENWDESNHYISIQFDSSAETYILRMWDEVDKVLEVMQYCHNYERLIQKVADELFIYQNTDDEPEEDPEDEFGHW